MNHTRTSTVEGLRASLAHRLSVNRIELQALQDERDWLDTMAKDVESLDPHDAEAIRRYGNLLERGA